MDTPEKSKRPWWRRKRTWAAVALALAVSYPLSLGPAVYAANRKWIDGSTFSVYSRPGITALKSVPGSDRYFDLLNWWAELGQSHHRAGSG